MSFIVDIYTRKRADTTWDVFTKYANDDPIQLGYVTYDETYSHSDPWVMRGLYDSDPMGSGATKREAVQMISAKVLEHFDSASCRYGKQTWTWARVS